jgi:hypothetical protein
MLERCNFINLELNRTSILVLDRKSCREEGNGENKDGRIG